MSIPTKLWIAICALAAAFGVGYGYGHHVASVEAKADAQELELSRAGDANKAWAERFALQAQLATRDQQLASSQAEAAQKRTEIVIKREVIYRDKIMGEGLHATTTNLAEIREYGKNTNLITRRLTGQEWNDALVLMKTHQMIELPGAVANLEDFTPIYIYSTVNVFCSAMDINELVRTYQDEVEELLTEEEKEN